MIDRTSVSSILRVVVVLVLGLLLLREALGAFAAPTLLHGGTAVVAATVYTLRGLACLVTVIAVATGRRWAVPIAAVLLAQAIVTHRVFGAADPLAFSSTLERILGVALAAALLDLRLRRDRAPQDASASRPPAS